MITRTCKSARTVLHGVFASVLALLAFALCAPQLAFADETTQTINGTMTITLQDGGGSSGAATGDALMWLILGVVVLIAGAVYIFIKSRHLATNTGAHANNDASSKKKTIIVAVITALIACMCFGMFANKGVAFAKDTFNNIFGSSAVVVDNNGNVVSNNITVINDEDEAIIVKSIEAPAKLSNWNADIANKTIESGAVAEGAWDGKTIPATLLEQLKNNNGYAELSFIMNVDDAKTPLNFEEFYVETEGLTYTGQQITPVVSSLVYGDGDFEVIYGENINAGVGSVTIKGIGDYKGEKTYIFTIEQATPVFDAPDSFTAEVGQTLADFTLPTYENGILAWNDPTASVGEIGEHEFTATFTPFDTKNYKSAEATIIVIVKEKVAFAVYSATDNSLTFYKKLENKIPAEGTTDSKGRTVTEVYKDFEKVEYGEAGAPWCKYGSVITSVEIADDGIAPTSMHRWFQNFTALTSIDVSGFDTSSVSNMSVVFSNCTSLTSIKGLENWKTQNVKSMHSLFSYCSALTSVDGIANWDTSSLTSIDWMFANCASLTSINLSAWKSVSSLTSAQVTFQGCTALQNVNISGWNKSALASTLAMFSGCTNLESITDIENLNTSNVTNMERMFMNCTKLSANCSGWTVKSEINNFRFNYNANGVTPPSAWSNQVNASVASNNPLSAPVTASVVAGEKTLAVTTASDNASKVDQNVDSVNATNSEETATTEAGSAEDASEATDKVSSTAESDVILQEVNCLSALSKENSSEAEMKVVA
jgi:surface protein